jgi:BRCA1-associated protein
VHPLRTALKLDARYTGNCLSKWAGGKCPVCRYSSSRSKTAALEDRAQANACDVCNAGSRGESLWMCLLCGHVGCGRYQGGHAAAHFEQTMHLYAIELDSQRVWDYAGDACAMLLVRSLTASKQRRTATYTD